MNKVVNRVDKLMYIALLALVAFVPYSAVLIEAALLVMMIGWQVKHFLIWKNNPRQGVWNSYKLPFYQLQWPMIALGLLILLTLPLSHAPALTLKKFFSRFLQQVLLVYLVVELVNTPKRLYQLMAILLGTLAVVNADVVAQYFSGHSFIYVKHTMLFQRVSGPMRHPNDLGTLLVMSLPIILSLIIIRRSWMSALFKSKIAVVITILSWVLFLCSMVSLGLTSSRGAWLAFALTMTGWSLYLRNRKIIAGVILVLIIFFTFFGIRCMNTRFDISPEVVVNSEVVVSSQATVNSKISANSEVTNNFAIKSAYNSGKIFFNPSRRGEYWQTAGKIIQRYPFFGCGYNTYIQTLQQFNLFPQEYPHNSILHIMAEMGIIGLLIYLWFWALLFISGAKILKSIFLNSDLYILGVGVYFSLLAWLIHSFTDTAWESLQLSIFWWFLVGILFSLPSVFQQLNLRPAECGLSKERS